MSKEFPPVRNISDTARWVAAYRARETDRPDALFKDPLAKRLAGEQGQQIADALTLKKDISWPWVTRTILFDRFIDEQVRDGAQQIINLAAGLDTRPYRMNLPPSLNWVEVDLPDLLAEKEAALAGEKPRCKLERIACDLTDLPARRALFDKLNARNLRTLIVSEGLIIYLTNEQAGSLATDLAARSNFHRWVFEVTSPRLLLMLRKRIAKPLDEAGAVLKFAPPEGPAFFEPYGWTAIDVRSFFKTAAKLGRLPFFLRLLAMLPEKKGPPGNRIWSAICLFEKTAPH